MLARGSVRDRASVDVPPDRRAEPLPLPVRQRASRWRPARCPLRTIS